MSLVQMSFSASVLILVIIVIRALAINKLPKKTFLALWAIALLRLLVPFSFSSTFSVYSVISNNTTVAQNIAGTPAANFFPMTVPISIPSGDLTLTPDLITTLTPALSVWEVIWIIGTAFCALYFVIVYVKSYREFHKSTFIQNHFIDAWLVEHKIMRPICIRQSNRVTSPLTYGIIRPVILLPINLDWSDKTQLQYILAHEYTHIRNFDVVTKLFLTAALCIHWFNPLVWAMYILSNRDIELSCDETVVRSFGETIKSSYARALIGMEEKRGGLTPYCNSFSKNAIEERIIAIMKFKKTSLITVLTAIIMVCCVTTVFATSAATQSINRLASYPNPTTPTEDYDKLLTLQFDGYQTMSIAEYSKKVIEKMENTEGYSNLIEKLWQDKKLEKMRYTNAAASFYFDTLLPVLFPNRGRYFTNSESAYSTQGNSSIVLYTHLDEKRLTIKEYDAAIQGFMNDFRSFYKGKNTADLQNKKAIQKEIEQIKAKWENEFLQFDVEYGDYRTGREKLWK